MPLNIKIGRQPRSTLRLNVHAILNHLDNDFANRLDVVVRSLTLPEGDAGEVGTETQVIRPPRPHTLHWLAEGKLHIL